jgi:hypothetical protein
LRDSNAKPTKAQEALSYQKQAEKKPAKSKPPTKNRFHSEPIYQSISKERFELMKHILPILLIVLCLGCQQDTVAPVSTNNFSMVASLGKASAIYPLKVGASKRYLVDQTNTPVLLSVDAGWSLICGGYANLKAADADNYLKTRAAYGFNVVIVNLIEHQFCSNPPANAYGVKPFTGKVFTTPNEAYFKYADSVVNMAAIYGITVMLFPAYSGYQLGSQGWGAEMQSASTSDMLSWGQYVGNRYKNFPNVIWCIGGDANPGSIQSKLQAVLTGIRNTDPNHLITAHNAPESFGITPWSGQLDINDVYTYSSTLYSNDKTAYNYSPTMPYFLMETDYENEHGASQQLLRAQAYWTILSGGCGEVFGNNPMWEFSNGWQAALTSAGSLSMENLALLFNSRNWYNLVPDFNNTIITNGSGSSTTYATASSASDGSSIIAYLPSSRQITVNTNGLLDATVVAYWFNPSNAAVTQLGTFARGTMTVSPPSSGDWVFVADAPSFNFGAPGGVVVGPNAPTGTIGAVPTTLPLGGGQATLTWSSQNATSASINLGVGTVALNGSVVVNLTLTTTYVLTLTGAGGTTLYPVTVTVATPPLPTATFTATPSSLPIGGGQTTLKWTSQNGVTAAIVPGIGPVNLNDSLVVTDAVTTTYTLTISNTIGSNSYNQKVTVAVPAPLFEAMYDETYENSWNTIRSWTTTLTPNNTSPVEDGTYSLKVVAGAWASLQFSKGNWGSFASISPAGYSSVSFWINGGPNGANGLKLSCVNSAGSNIKTVTIPNVPANTWVQQTTPMSSLAGTTSFVALGIFNNSGSTITFYVDDLQLNK